MADDHASVKLHCGEIPWYSPGYAFATCCWTSDPPEQPGGQNARVVHDEAVPSPEEPAEVRHPGVPEGPRPPVEDQEARAIAILRGLLGNPIRRQR